MKMGAKGMRIVKISILQRPSKINLDFHCFFMFFGKADASISASFSVENSVNVRLASKAMKVDSDRAGSIRIDIRHFWSIAENYKKT